MQAFELLGHAEYSILHGSKGPKHFESQGCYWVMRKVIRELTVWISRLYPKAPQQFLFGVHM